MHITSCRTYHAQTVGRSLVHMPDGTSAFKVYYISVIGRDTPERFEWQHCSRSFAEFETALLDGKYEGVGFVTAFPHVTKIFRFSPQGETVLDVREFYTDGMRPMDCARGDGFHEFACYAEAAIAADEYQAWAKASTVAEYLAFRSDAADFPVVAHTKLAAHCNNPRVSG